MPIKELWLGTTVTTLVLTFFPAKFMFNCSYLEWKSELLCVKTNYRFKANTLIEFNCRYSWLLFSISCRWQFKHPQVMLLIISSVPFPFYLVEPAWLWHQVEKRPRSAPFYPLPIYVLRICWTSPWGVGGGSIYLALDPLSTFLLCRLFSMDPLHLGWLNLASQAHTLKPAEDSRFPNVHEDMHPFFWPSPEQGSCPCQAICGQVPSSIPSLLLIIEFFIIAYEESGWNWNNAKRRVRLPNQVNFRKIILQF